MDHRAVRRARRALSAGPGARFSPHPAPAGPARRARGRVDGARRPRAELRLVRGAALLHRAAAAPAARRARPRRLAHRVRRGRAVAAGPRLRPEPGARAPCRGSHRDRGLRPHAAPGRAPARTDRRSAAYPPRTRRHRTPRRHPRRTPSALHGDPRHPRAGPVQPADAAPGRGPHLGRRPGDRPPPCPYGHRHRRAQPRRSAPLRPRPGTGGPRGRWRPGGGAVRTGHPRNGAGPRTAHRSLPCGGDAARGTARPGAVRTAAHRPGRPGQCEGARGRHGGRADTDPPGRPDRTGHRRQRPRLHPARTGGSPWKPHTGVGPPRPPAAPAPYLGAAALRPPAGVRGHGLPAMRARLHQLGGTLTIESAPGEGTVVSAEVPLPAPAPSPSPSPSPEESS